LKNVQDVSYQVHYLLPNFQRSCLVKNEIHLTSDFLPHQALMLIISVQSVYKVCFRFE